MEEEEERIPTGKLPWLTNMKVDFDQSSFENFFVCDFFVEIMAN